MRKIIALSTVAIGLTFGSFASVAAQDRWDGGDDLATNPLPCPAPQRSRCARLRRQRSAYDGGQPINPPDLAGQPITLVDIPKLIGIGYFNATAKGMQEAAAELGNVEVINDGPTERQHRRADHLHRQLHHPGCERHPLRRQRPGGHRPGAEEGSRCRHPCRRL